MVLEKIHTFHVLLLSALIGTTLLRGDLHASPVWQEMSRDSLAVPSKIDTLPYRIPASSYLRYPQDSTATAAPSTIVDQPALAPPAPTDLFGRDFRRQGSISRGFLVGSNRDATVVSGFRLQFAGPLTKDISVTAALTDENSPIQPEGTTQSLREVDQVSIDLSGPFFGVTLGDFFYQRSPSTAGSFGQLSRKVQGIKGTVQGALPGASAVHTSVGLVGASSRAEYHSILIKGVEGVQGPYRLTGKNGEQYIVVIAGSERVSVNGEQLVRGEVQDYIIDYATGEITFTTQRMITSDARIYVDFEYADRRYARNMVGADVEASLISGGLSIGFSVLQEADDPDNPVAGPLDDATLALLRASGSDRWKASRSGIVLVGTDSGTGGGRGSYAIRDTLVNGAVYGALVYAPGEPDAVFNVTFSRVDGVPSDSLGYRRVQGGEYVLAGIGTGTHVPRIFVEAPRLQRSMHGDVSAGVGGGLTLFAEGSGSMLDRNRLSETDDPVNAGDAYELRMVYDPGELRLRGASMGTFRAELGQRYVDERYTAFGRIDPVEYRREWDIELSRPASEWRRQFSAAYSPVSLVTVTTFLGSMHRSDGTTSDRIRAGLQVQDSGGIDIHGSAERVNRREDRSRRGSIWDRYSAAAGIPLGFGTPSVEVRVEDRRERSDSLAALTEGGFRFVEVIPRFATVLARGWDLRGTASWRSEDSSLAGRMAPSFVSASAGMNTSYTASRNATASLDLQTRRTSFTDRFRVRGNKDTRTTLVRTQASARGFGNGLETRVLYEFSSQQSSRLERIFVRVASGTGQFAYVGDRNGNGIADESDYEPVRYDGDYAQILVPGETLVPVHAAKASLRLRLRLKELGLGGVFSRFSTESYVRIEEKSTDPSGSSIALLDLARFLNPVTTIAGQQLLTNDIHFNENSPEYSIRLRATESRGLTQLVRSPITAYGNERSLRFRGRISDEVNDQIDMFVKRDRSLGDALATRNRDLVLTGGTNDLAYRLDRFWELGLVLGLTRAENLGAGNTGIADLNEQAVRVTYGFPSRGSVRAEFRREEVTLSRMSMPNLIPFEMTGGRAVGRTWSVEVRGDLRLTDIIQVSMSYSGRLENASPVVHTARAEARAVF